MNTLGEGVDLTYLDVRYIRVTMTTLGAGVDLTYLDVR